MKGSDNFCNRFYSSILATDKENCLNRVLFTFNLKITAMNIPLSNSAGLAPLQNASKILIKQKKEMLEIFTNWESNNRYEITNEQGQHIFFAIEDTGCCWRMCCGPARPFCIRILDNSGQQVMVVQAEFACCTRTVNVESPPGQHIGSVYQEFAFFTPSFYVRNAGGDALFKIKSPMAACCGSCSNVEFDIVNSKDEQQEVGKITKQFGGWLREMFTDADTFGLSFPVDLNVSWKAALLAAAFVVDFAYYERTKQSSSSSSSNNN